MLREQGINPGILFRSHCVNTSMIQKLFFLINDFEIGTTIILQYCPSESEFSILCVGEICMSDGSAICSLHARDMHVCYYNRHR